MTTELQNQEVAGVLVVIGRSFLQYVGESWPWASDESLEKRARIMELVGRQQDDVQAVVDYLISAGEAVELGAYPTPYTDLQYLDVDYLIKLLVENQTQVVEKVEAAAGRTGEMLADIVESERSILDGLKQLQSAGVV